ncbi:DNRLRE domain-containing protein [Streptomyces sp. HPF1205]|uniref:DNRLRE domain-containing protein n=1 Tax=Streptomyces sp. HPF1205 TaxID=2873262 RepID=UPI001CEDDF20|nr:DNRLRE domain-containing protein [Streptomyces sp. HPF1205]
MTDGLPWWQAIFVLAPWALGPVAGSQSGAKFGGGFIGAVLAGGVGGAIGGGAAMVCSKLARRPGNAGLKIIALSCVGALAYGTFFTVADLVSSALPPVPASAASPPPGWPSPAGAAPAATQTPEYNPTAPVTPPWMRQPVSLDPPTVLHATGAELHWPAVYDGSSPASGPADLEVYRGPQADFTPSPATLIAKLDAKASGFVDRTAPAASGSHLDHYYYMVAVRTKDDGLIIGNFQFAQLPPRGETEVLVPATAAATLNSAYPEVSNPGLTGVNPDIAGHGAGRGIFRFGPMSEVPRGAHVSSVHLGVACNGSDPGPLEVHALTRSFTERATWHNAAPGVAWSHPGGDYAGPAARSLPTAGFCLWDVTSIVHRWSVSPKSEHGLLLRFTDESSSSPHGGFNDGSMRPGEEPQLLVTYTRGS